MRIGNIIDGKYEIVALIGQGGMGSVYEARHTIIKRRYAVKILHAQFAENKNVSQRFILEAQAAAAIGSDHIIEVTDAGTTNDGCPYLVMELLEGEDLAAVLERQGPLAPARAAGLVSQACEALAAAHRSGIVHRDLKPGNLFVARRPDGREWLKVLDFGIAKFKDLSLTPTQFMLGTIFYMSPEQAEIAKEVDGRADIYSMGVILYEALTGHLPFPARELRQVLAQVLTGLSIPPTTHRPDLPAELEKVVLRAMAKEREDRFQSMEALAAALRPFVDEPHGAVEHAEPPSAGEAKSIAGSEDVEPAVAGFARTRLESTEPPPSAPSTSVLRSLPPRGLLRRGRLLAVSGVVVIGLAAATVLIVTDIGPTATARSPAGGARNTARPAVATTAAAGSAPGPVADSNRWVHVGKSPGRILLGLPQGLVSSSSIGFHPDRRISAPDYDYELQQHEVTWGELRPWLAAHPEARTSAGWQPAFGGAQLPAVGVPWEIGHGYCQSLGGALPTEEEWEYAARGPTARFYPWGSDAVDLERTHVYRPGRPLSEVMTNDQDATPGGVGQAIHDLLGNAQEWTASLWREDAPGQPEEWVQSGSLSFRAVRGLPPSEPAPETIPPVGAAYREPLCATGTCPPETSQDIAVVGFRCARRSP
jgi:eukaryotic-like serine/threonine-protein kinase